MVLKNINAITPGKAILFGEHFVVYGYSSIIFAIDKSFIVTLYLDKTNKKEYYNGKKIKIFSNLGINAEITDSRINLYDNKSSNYNIVNKLKKTINYLINNDFDNSKEKLSGDLVLYIDSEI